MSLKQLTVDVTTYDLRPLGAQLNGKLAQLADKLLDEGYVLDVATKALPHLVTNTL